MQAYKTYTESHDFQIGMRALSKYNRLAYKYIILELLPSIRKGSLIGERLENNYKVILPCDDKFKQVYGELYLIYHLDNDVAVFDLIEPFDDLKSMHVKYVDTINGIPITNNKVKFKMMLLQKMNKEG